MDLTPRERFGRRVQLTPEACRAFAAAAGDDNPLHDPEDPLARSGDAGGPAASGPHTSALLMGAVASHVSRVAPMVGLEFRFVFRELVPADATVELEWLVAGVRETSRPERRVAKLYGRLRLPDGRTAVGASGTVLFGAGLFGLRD